MDGTETQQPSGSFQNVKEAERVVALILDYKKRNKGKHYNVKGRPGATDSWFSINSIRVITFYQAHVALLSNMLDANHLQPAVSTVDSSQGSKADLVVLSFVRTGKTNAIDFSSDDRRLNVALTHAKHKLICIGNSTSYRK